MSKMEFNFATNKSVCNDAISPFLIGVIDHGFANIASLVNALNYIGFATCVISSKSDFAQKVIDGFILPGVGSFSAAITSLRNRKLDHVIFDLLEKGTSGMGICLGMQMLVNSSEEGGGNEKGLGLFEGHVIKLPNNHEQVPRIGWSETKSTSTNPIIGNLLSNDFYYLHSYTAKLDNPNEIAATFKHGYDNYASAIYKPKLLGVQFHPEKSQEMGLRLIKEFFLNS